MSESEAFLYMWYNGVTKRYYLGWHKGSWYDDYQTSATNKDFWKDFNHKRCRRRKIAEGSAVSMEALEHKLLKQIDAKNNPRYYNLSNGGIMRKSQRSMHMYFSKATALAASVSNLTKVKRDKQELFDMSRVQVRPVLVYPSKVTQIATLMSRTGTQDASPVIVIKDYYGSAVKYDEVTDRWLDITVDGGEVIIDGNHTTHAAQKVSSISELDTIELSFDTDLENSEEFVTCFGDELNKPGQIKTPPDDKECEYKIEKAYDSGNGVDITDSLWQKNFAIQMGKTQKKIDTLSSKVIKKVAAAKRLSTGIFVPWSKSKLDQEVSNWQALHPDAIVTKSNSKRISDTGLGGALHQLANDSQNRQRVVILCHHATYADLTSNSYATAIKNVETYKAKGLSYDIDIVMLPHTTSTP